MRRKIGRRTLTIEGAALVPTERSHGPGLAMAVEASLDELRPWMAWAGEASLEQTFAFAIRAEEGWNESSGWMFTIVHDDEPVGTVGLERYEEMLQRAEMGYWIRSDLAGRGVMTRAARAVAAFGFDEVGLHRIELHASPENVASVKVAEAVGFRREGFARDIARSVDGFYDCWTFGLLATDLRPNR